VRSRTDLHHYQQRAIDFILERKRCALWLDLGLGKTVTTLTAIVDLLDSFAVSRVLVIAPLRVANSVWKQEAQQWAHLRHLSINVATGGSRSRIAALCREAHINVINRENVEWLVGHYGDRWPFDMVVVDEASSFKSPSSKRFKALRRVIGRSAYRVLLTGTPSPNGLLDLWAQFYLLDHGERLGRTMTSYKSLWFEPADYYGYRLKPREGSQRAIQAAIAPITLSMSAADYLELPDRLDSVVKVQLPPGRMDDYKRLERDFLLELDNAEINAINAATLANKCLQYCNGAVIVDDVGTWREVHPAKLEALADIIDDNSSEPLLVAYNYRADLERLQKRFPQAVTLDKSPETIDRWNRGEIPLLLAHPASAGHGLNLQHGGSIIVWFGLNWSLELDQQFNARLHRQGQLRPVRVIRLVAEGCIDERVCQALAGKALTQQALIDAVKASYK
jgi:SNF2 family DNA or RNA helicase